MSIIWRGDDLGAWHGSEMFDKSRLSVVDVQRGGKSVKAFRFSVKPTDIVQNGVRCELIRDDHRPEGTERFTAFSVLFPKGLFPTMAKKWQVFHQYHQSYKNDVTIGQSPPVEFALNGDTMQLNVNGWQKKADGSYPVKTLWTAPLEFDKWYDFVLHAKWSSDPSIGFLRLFLHNNEVLPRTAASTMFPGYDVYMKAGIYRSRDIQPDAILYQTGFLEATTLDEAMKAAPAPEPAPAPEDKGWRVGRQLGRTLYLDGKLMGMMDDAKVAQQICDAMNLKASG